MAALGDDLSINFYLFSLDERYITCPWLKLGCARPGCCRCLLLNSTQSSTQMCLQVDLEKETVLVVR